MINKKEYAKDFTRQEVMVVAGAHELNNGEIGIIGVGLPQVSGILAKFTHAPDLRVLLELGIVDPKPVHTSSGLGDPRIWYGTTCMTNWLDIMGMALHRGIVDVGFLGGIQVDQYGNQEVVYGLYCEVYNEKIEKTRFQGMITARVTYPIDEILLYVKMADFGSFLQQGEFPFELYIGVL